MMDLKSLELWFVTGSQHLYGEETLAEVAKHSGEIAQALNASIDIPVKIVFKPVVKTTDEIFQICQDVNQSKACIGIITWMHTFSPAKMWISGLKTLQKPLLHLHTQFNSDIPWNTIDMNFMNTNQSAHGDREFGFMMSRMRMNRKVVVGHWQDPEVIKEIGVWSRSAIGWYESHRIKVVRFGDNMRFVAVTEGDKVEAELKFGYSVNSYGIGDLVKVINEVSDSDVNQTIEEYGDLYVIADSLQKNGAAHSSLRDAARIETGMRNFLQSGGFTAFTDTFEDLHGMAQLPGIAVQRLMSEGYGFAGEGDWKTAALVRTMKIMATGLTGGNAFMEDYTYHFNAENPQVLGSHMLEICPSIASGKVNCEIHPLGIGGKSDPVRLVFNSAAGAAINVSVVDMGNRFRMILNEVEAIEPAFDLPKLPVARVLWKPLPDMKTGCAAWIYAGGAHHTCYSQNLSTAHIQDLADIAGIELVVINKDTTIQNLKNELRWNDSAYGYLNK